MYDYNSIPIGYVARYKFSFDKKSNWLDLSTKDQRQFKFKFESAYSYQSALDAFEKHCSINKHRDLFAYDYSKKCDSNDIEVLNDNMVNAEVMKEFMRMKVHDSKDRFKKMDLPDKLRIKLRIDLPSEVYVPKDLLDDQIYGCAVSRNNGRFPVLAYYNPQLNIALWRSSEP